MESLADTLIDEKGVVETRKLSQSLANTPMEEKGVVS